jgi:ribosomal protein S18 acetylase RimI-like enzyme
MGIEIRRADPLGDTDAILAVGTDFETSTILSVERRPDGFALAEQPVEPPVVKSFPVDDLGDDRRWDSAWLAFEDATPVGFIATGLEQWNCRMVIWHFYVSRPHRGRGIGRRLVDAAVDAARSRGATRAWLETSNLNAPGVAAYRRLGFEIVGFDLSLYDNTEAAGEVALFLSRALA